MSIRKRTVRSITDELMWFLIYTFPILFILIGIHHGGYDGMLSYITTNFAAVESTFIFETFDGIFGADGILPLFIGNWIIFEYYAVYFIIMLILHVLIDVMAFIPRLAHAWMGKFTGGDC